MNRIPVEQTCVFAGRLLNRHACSDPKPARHSGCSPLQAPRPRATCADIHVTQWKGNTHTVPELSDLKPNKFTQAHLSAAANPFFLAWLIPPPRFLSCYKLITEVNQNVLKRRRTDKSKKMQHPQKRNIFYSSTTLAVLS